MLMLPGKGTIVTQLGSSFALFNCDDQSLYEIDRPAAWVWRQVSSHDTGMERSHLSGRLSSEFSLTIADAETLLDRYVELGILHACMVSASAFTIRLNDTRWLIESPAELSAELKGLCRGMLAPIELLRSHRHIVIRTNSHRYELTADDKCLGAFNYSEIVPAIKSFLTDALLQTEFTLALHAALLHRGDRQLLIAGPSGAGKTTLALALTAESRWSMRGDDIVMVDERSGLRGVPFPIAVKDGSWTLLRNRWPQLASSRVNIRSDGKIVKFLPCEADHDDSSTPCSTTMIFISRTLAGRCSLSRLSPLMAFQRLLVEAASPTQKLTDRAFGSLAELVNRAQAFEMDVGNLEDAIQVIGSL
jgi:hypothetical protein